MTVQHGGQVREPVAGLILAGGRARRMGGQDKGLVPLARRAMIEHVLDRIRPQVDEVVISANRNQDVYARYGHRVIEDVLDDYSGPLAGMLSALLVVRQPWLAVVPCDSPLLPGELVERLLSSALAGSAELAVAHDGERLQPVIALLHHSLLTPLRAFVQGGGRKIDTWYAQHRMVTTDLSDHPEAFVNINTPEDHAALERQVLAQPPCRSL
ncbi:MAG: molybdenum cofactor guanylyltransferase [Thioalkalivibrio sp.]|nr:MAG: molybdenum cofactor guanylyltransferase [Thioalkalivibrio sp.]